jgi:hypothetical protein
MYVVIYVQIMIDYDFGWHVRYENKLVTPM